jgi:poly(3-hydroxybutyrate) depolymerase
MARSSGLSALADRHGFLVAYPQGLAQQHGRGPTGRTLWIAETGADAVVKVTLP